MNTALVECRSLQLTAVGDDDRRLGHVAAASGNVVHVLQHLGTVNKLAEHNVLAIEVGRVRGAHEELTAVGVGAGVGHGQAAETGVHTSLALEGLVLELGTVDGLTTSAVAAGEVAALAHLQHER